MRTAGPLTGEDGGQLSTWAIERAMRKARGEVKGLPAGFRYHDLRHYSASLLIADGADVKTVQRGYGMPAPRPPSTRTGTSGPTVTSRPGPP
jgi:integrase